MYLSLQEQITINGEFDFRVLDMKTCQIGNYEQNKYNFCDSNHKQLKVVNYFMDLFTLHLISTLKTELLEIAIMIDTDNSCTREDIKESLLELITKELEEYGVSLLYRKTNKE